MMIFINNISALTRYVTLSLCALSAIMLSGCNALPDLEHAQNSLRNGYVQKGTEELAELARFGVPDSKIALGDLVSEVDPKQAVSFYLDAARDGEFRAQSRLAKFYAARAKTFSDEDALQSLKHIRAALRAGDDSVLTTLVRLTYTFPSLQLEKETTRHIKKFKKKRSVSAQYSEILQWEYQGHVLKNAAIIESTCLKLDYLEGGCYRSLINLYQMQGKPDQVAKVIATVIDRYQEHKISETALIGFAKWITRPERNPKLVDEALKILAAIAPMSSAAEYATAKILYANPSGQKPERLLEILNSQQEKGNWLASQLKAKFYFYGKNDVWDPEQAKPILLSIKDKSPTANYILGLIYRDGLSDDKNLEAALDYLLIAARFDHPKADLALAQTFWDGRGIQQNRIYAYAFASIAVSKKTDGAQKILDDVALNMTAADIGQAQQIVQQEQNARAALRRNYAVCCSASLTLAP